MIVPDDHGRVTQGERIRLLLLSVELGPIAPFFGIVNGQCECGEPRGKDRFGNDHFKFAKHPHRSALLRNALDWKHQTTRDPAKLIQWAKDWPFCNFAIALGFTNIVVVDVDEGNGKDGLAELAALEQAAGQKLPATITVLSGSNTGARHLYFVLPSGVSPDDLGKPKGTNWIDYPGASIVPGSLHESGHRYSFLAGHDPEESEIAELPGWMVDLMRRPPGSKQKKSTKRGPDNVGTLFDDLLREGPPKGSPPPGRPKPNNIVEARMKKVPMRSVKKLDGSWDRSKSDLRYASSLAFFSAHNWKQFLELWQTLGIRDLPDTKCGRASYERDCLTRAFLNQQTQWKNKDKRVRPIQLDHPLADLIKKMRGTGKTFSQPRSQNTVDILAAHHDEPHLKDAALVKKLNSAKTTDHTFRRDEVKKVRGRYPHLWS